MAEGLALPGDISERPSSRQAWPQDGDDLYGPESARSAPGLYTDGNTPKAMEDEVWKHIHIMS